MMLIKPTHDRSSVKCFFIGQYDFVYCWVDFSSCFVVFAALTNTLLRFSFRCRPVHRLWSPTSAWNGQCYQEIIKWWWVKCVPFSVVEKRLGNKISHVMLHCDLWSGSLMIFKHYNQRPYNLTNKSSTRWAPLFRSYLTAIRSSVIVDHKIGSSCHWADLKLCEATTAQTDVSYQVMSLLALHF